MKDEKQAVDRVEALAVAFANLKGSKRKDLIRTAHALDFLKKLPEFRSNQLVAEEVGVSAEIVREFLMLLELPEDVQELINTKRLGLEHGRRLRQLGRHRPSIVTDAARAAAHMTALDARNMVDYLIKHPTATVPDAQQMIADSKPVITHEYRVEVSLAAEKFKQLAAEARRLRQSVNSLACEIVAGWLDQQRRDDSVQ